MNNTLTFLVKNRVSGDGCREAIRYKECHDCGWIGTTWDEFGGYVDNASRALESIGVKPQGTVAVFSANRPEILYTDFAAFANRAIPVSIYSTSSAEQVRYIVNDSKASVIFVGTHEQYIIARAEMPNMPSLKLIVTYDDVKREAVDDSTLTFKEFLELGAKTSDECHREVEARTAAAQPDDIATLLYTSGTTGEPKGAVLTHSNFDSIIEIHIRRLTMLSDKDTSLSFLPLSHIFEKAWTYFCLNLGIVVN
ncbi:MAG: AMP-binding protein, partial [Muribaculaceae bacterium]|nr:AMP-binding protein [Muribaculaceae bacterium]